MATIKVPIRDSLWREYLELCADRGWEPRDLVEGVVLDFIQRLADAELEASTRQAALRSNVREADVEEAIREIRREKARKAANGRTKKAHGSGS